MPTFVWGVAAGITFGVLYAVSPLSLMTVVGAAALLCVAGRGLPPEERRRIVWILGAALAVRFVFIAILLVSNIPHLSDLGIGGLRGDDAYVWPPAPDMTPRASGRP